jgi:hypothetical protein
MTTQTYSYRGYEIPITFMSPLWQAEIYPTVPGVPPIDRTEPIRATSVEEAYLVAQRRIDEMLRRYPSELLRDRRH